MKITCNLIPKILPGLFKNANASWKVLMLLLCFMANSASAQDNPPIGETIVAIGDVKAINSKKVERAIKRGDAFETLDKFVIGAASKAQLKFSDGGIINLIASTEYMVDSYVFNDPAQKSHSLSSLAKGGFRAISGAIAKENITGTLIRTPIATIGLRGTIYEALLADGKLFVGCEEGKLVVSNAQGKLEIGPSASTLYAIVSKEEAPKPAKEKPTELAAVSFDVEGGQTIIAQPIGTQAVQQPIPVPVVPSSASTSLVKPEKNSEAQTPSGTAAFSQPTPTEPFREGVFNVSPAGRTTAGLESGQNVEPGILPVEREVFNDYASINLNEVPYDYYEEGTAYEGSTSATYLAPTLAIGALSLVGIIVVVYQCAPEHHSKSHSSSRSSGPCYCH